MTQCDDAISKARRAICGAIRELQAANIPVPQALYAALAQLQAGAFQSKSREQRQARAMNAERSRRAASSGLRR